MRKMLFLLAHGLLKIPLKHYHYFRIYRFDPAVIREPDPREGWAARLLTPDDLRASGDERFEQLGSYTGPDQWCFGVEVDRRLVCAIRVAAGNRYKQIRGDFWPLGEHEAELGKLVTLEEARGKGLGTFLLSYSVRRMGEMSFRPLYARVWHSNHASIRVNEKIGSVWCATVLELGIRGLKRPLRITRPTIKGTHNNK